MNKINFYKSAELVATISEITEGSWNVDYVSVNITDSEGQNFSVGTVFTLTQDVIDYLQSVGITYEIN